MEEEKKPARGGELRKKVEEELMRGRNPEQKTNKETAEDYDKKTKDVEAQQRYQGVIDNINYPQSRQDMEARERERIDNERKEEASERKRLENEINQRAQADLEEAKRAAQEEATERKRLEDEKRAAERTTLEQKQVEMAEKFNQAMQANSPKTFLENYRVWKELQHELDPEDRPHVGVADPQVSLEIKRMELQQAREEREFKWKMRQDDKQFQLALQKLEDDRGFRRMELEQQAKKDQMFATLPQRIGASIAKGMMDNEEGGQPQSYRIQAGLGEAGETVCPKCGSAVGIGPHSQTAVCANCKRRFPVERIPATSREEPEPEPVEEE